jgi:hypothetical protein
VSVAAAPRPLELPAGQAPDLPAVRRTLRAQIARLDAQLSALVVDDALPGASRPRRRLEAMLAAPGRHRFERVSLAELGQSGCGAYAVRPRLGVIGMLAGWWEVKLSSGCPLGSPRPSSPLR